MIALLLGLLLIGGIITVFVSSQQAYRTKTTFDNAQEAFRFASYTITRVTRNADGVHPSSSGDQLVLELTGFGDLVTDCLGNIVENGSTVTNTFFVNPNGDELLCDSGNGTAARLVSGIGTISFRYGLGSGYMINTDYLLPEDGSINWDGVRAVRTTLTMAEAPLVTDLTITFTSAIRSVITPDIIVIRPPD